MLIDIHSHIIPFVDDGCKSLEEMDLMLNKYISIGVKRIIATPHFELMPLRSHPTVNLLESFDLLKRYIKDNNMPLEVYLGAEIAYSKGIAQALMQKKVNSLNNSKYILLELYDIDVDSEIEEIFYEMSVAGYQIVIAHLERYHSLEPKKVKFIKDLGIKIQINASAVLQKSIQKKIFKLISLGYIDFVASDVHFTRENNFLEAFNLLKKKFKGKAEKLFADNAEIFFI
ncbi:MAG: hypothetical protein LBM99_03545 [Bacillales bacterium]|jgi:protein-tyrosine phosphatase|nr:hypothetical protein [Bacillales bacterium]